MSDTATSGTATEEHRFGAEVGRLLDLVVHSLYSEREIFLRELVANAADATDRRRFLGLSDATLAPPEGACIRITPDKPARTLTIADQGVGMTREELVHNLGTIARSGTKLFGETLAAAKPEDRPSLIGQFGVGFYAAFMVADRVAVTSRAVGAAEAFTWESTGQGAFTITQGQRDEAGTTVTLHIKADAEEFLEPYRLETIIRKWADHITLPIIVVQDGKDVPANEGTALWRRPKSEVTESQYEEFYRHLGHFFGKPWLTLHWRAEGAMEFSALLFVPDAKPFQPVEDDRKCRVRLHVRRMFITNDAELLPSWLRFIDGVVDTEDLPLNVSREMLQATPVLARIRRAVTNRVLTELKAAAADPARGYDKFWENFGHVLKEGVWEDSDHREALAGLLRFRSTGQDGWTSLAAYKARMKPEQEAIYYLTGDTADALRSSAQLEGFTARGFEVLLMTDPIDSFWPDRLADFDKTPLRSVGQAADDLAKLPPPAEQGAAPTDLPALISALKAALDGQASDVRTTERLVESAVVLAAPPGADLARQRLLRRTGRGGNETAPVLEINPRHKVIHNLAASVASGRDIAAEARLLLDLARVQDGEAPTDPALFARHVLRLLEAEPGLA